jgi:hypothetical protein
MTVAEAMAAMAVAMKVRIISLFIIKTYITLPYKLIELYKSQHQMFNLKVEILNSSLARKKLSEKL